MLKDKIVVYDLAGQRIGWANYDCKFGLYPRFKLTNFMCFLHLILVYLIFVGSSSVNVSTSNTGTTEFVDAGQFGRNASPRYEPSNQLLTTFICLLLQITFFGFLLPFL